LLENSLTCIDQAHCLSPNDRTVEILMTLE
jgi:hypothetical protein